jgi:single-stranded-DNA-specific exonuclease
VGRERTTIRCFLEGEGGGRLKALRFRAGDDDPLAKALSTCPGAPLHLAGHLRAEGWNGTTSASFIVTDAALP